MGWVSCASWVFKDSLRNTLPIESRELSQAYFRDFEGCGRASLKKVTQVNVKKFSSTLVTFGGTIKSVKMSGSPAIASWMMANEEISSEKNFMVKVLEAMEERNLRYIGKN